MALIPILWHARNSYPNKTFYALFHDPMISAAWSIKRHGIKGLHLIHRGSNKVLGHMTNIHYNNTTSGGNPEFIAAENNKGSNARVASSSNPTSNTTEGDPSSPGRRIHHPGTLLQILAKLIARTATPMSTFECTQQTIHFGG